MPLMRLYQLFELGTLDTQTQAVTTELVAIYPSYPYMFSKPLLSICNILSSNE